MQAWLITLCACFVSLPAEAGPEIKPFAPKEALREAQFVRHTPEQAIAELQGKKLVGLYFTAKWCHPCQIFTPQLVKFRNEHKDAFQFVMMSWDKSLGEQQAYLDNEKMEVPAVRFDDPLPRSVARRFQVDGIPALLIFDGDGNFITGGGREQLSLAVHPSDIEALGDSPAAKAWREMIAPNQQAALKVREAELAPLVPVVEKHKNFPRLQEVFSLMGYFNKSREIDHLMAQIGRDIAADWDQKQGFVDEMVVLAGEFNSNTKWDRGLFESKGGPCFDELGKHAVEHPEIIAKLEGLLGSTHPYAQKWGQRGLVQAAERGSARAKEILQKLKDDSQKGSSNEATPANAGKAARVKSQK